MSNILDCIENKDLNLNITSKYAAILGESPSKGAKSPALWNAVFDKLQISGMMYPMDIRPEKLQDAVEALRLDERYIGGAITMPYKITILPFLDELEPEAKMIGAVNCIYRNGNKLVGTNTDGAGALWSLQQSMEGDLKGKTLLLIGAGGAGFAVASYVATAIGKKGTMFIANRNGETRKQLVQKLKDVCQSVEITHFPIEKDILRQIDIVVNCSSVGFETLKKDDKGCFSLKPYAPLGHIDDSIRVEQGETSEDEYLKKAKEAIMENNNMSKNSLSQMQAPFVFDIIYQPEKTRLLEIAESLGYKILNGLPMNLEQAVIAFVKATRAASLYQGGQDEVRTVMQESR